MTTSTHHASGNRAEQIDHLLKLVQEDIPRDQARIKGQKDPSPERAMVEMSGTVLEYLKDALRHLIEMRNWTYQSMTALSDHMESTDERLDVIENFGSETAILAEDAEVFAKVAVGCRFLAQTLLAGPFPIKERDEEGKQKLAELIAFCEQAERIIQDSVMTDEDDDEDEDDEDQEDVQSEEA